MFMVSGKHGSIEFRNWVLSVLKFLEKHDEGSGQNLPDQSLYRIFVDVVVHWQQIPSLRGGPVHKIFHDSVHKIFNDFHP